MTANIPDLDYWGIQAEAGRRKFREFIPQMWPIVEPAVPYIANWCSDAIAEHLQAVSEGQILRLVINVPPGHAKSLEVAVLWPAWEWCGKLNAPKGAPGPQRRGIYTSYDGDLATRDSMRCRAILRSDRFRQIYRPKWRFAGDQNVKSWFENDCKGFRMAFGVGGKGTGYRGDYMVCLSGDTEITTDRGFIPIARIVGDKLPVRILAFDHCSGSFGFRPIEVYESSAGRPSVRVSFSNGAFLECTTDHPVFVVGRGYTLASDLARGDQLLSGSSLPDLREGNAGAAPKDAPVSVVTVEPIETPVRVFNLRVACDHNYFAAGVLVHNCDDPLNVREQHSTPALEEVVFWWDQVMSSRLNNPMTGARVVIMQRISDRDLTAHVLRAGGYEHLCLPSEYEPERRCVTSIGWQDPRTEPGQLLFPQLFPEEAIAQAKKDLGSQGFAAQHQQRPAPAEGGVFKRHWWRYWKFPGQDLPPVVVRLPDNTLAEIEAQNLPSGFDELAQAWDMSFKDLKSSDFVAGGLWGRAGADKYLLEQVHGRMDFVKTKAAVRTMSAEHPEAGAKWVEDAANGPAIIAELKSEIPGLIPVPTSGGQVARARAVSPQVEAGNVFLPHPAIAAWVESFLAEADSFPYGHNDDQVAQLSHALVQLSKTETQQFFTDFRPLGPRPAEPKEACHVVSEMTLQPWWQRMLSIAWGEESAAHWYALDDKGRLQIYRELVATGAGAEQFAAMVAAMAAPELAAGASLIAYTAPDFFERGLVAKSVAQRITDGINAVLGDGGAFLWEFTPEEQAMDAENRYASLYARRKKLDKARLTVQAAAGDRVGGLEYLRGLLRWRPLMIPEAVEYDRTLARQIMDSPDRIERFQKYLAQVEGRVEEVLPKMLVWEQCSELIRCLSTATRADKDPADVEISSHMVALESLLYGALGHRGGENRPPLEVFTAQRLEQVVQHNPKADPMSLHMAAKKAERDWKGKKVRPFTFHRLPKRRT